MSLDTLGRRVGERTNRWMGPAHLDRDWMAFAACVDCDPEWWFPPERQGRYRGRRHNQAALEVCAVCPVVGECLRYALELNIQDGIWGGLSARQRQELRRRIRRVRTP